MKKSELLARIEALEAKVAALEARPVYLWPNYTSPTVPWPAPTQWPSPLIVTCNDLVAGSQTIPGQCYS